MSYQQLTGDQRIVLHEHRDWLNLTENWIYNQVFYLPTAINNHVICETTKNLDAFHLPNIHSFSEIPAWQKFLDLGLKKVKIQNHLGFFMRTARSLNPDILHSHYGPRAWENIAIAERNHIKHIVTFYGYDVNFLPRRYPQWLDRYQTLFKKVDRVLCEGSHMAKCIVNLGCPRDKVQVHHLGIDLNKIPFRPRRWQPREPLRILIAASFREKKGIPYAIEALGRFQHEQPIEVTIIGDATPDVSSQIEKKKILSLIKENRLSSKVTLLSFQPHDVLMEEAYKNHVFLSPSITSSVGDTEGGAPIAIVEMIASGMPVVSTTHCDIPEVAYNTEKSLLTEEKNVDGLIKHLQWLVSCPNYWKKMLVAGRQHVESEYDARIQGERLAKIYNDI